MNFVVIFINVAQDTDLKLITYILSLCHVTALGRPNATFRCLIQEVCVSLTMPVPYHIQGFVSTPALFGTENSF